MEDHRNPLKEKDFKRRKGDPQRAERKRTSPRIRDFFPLGGRTNRAVGKGGIRTIGGRGQFKRKRKDSQQKRRKGRGKRKVMHVE